MKKNVNLNLQKNGIIVLVAVGAIAVVALGWLLLIGPKQKQIGDLKQQTGAVRQQIADDVSRAATARGVTGAPQIKTADIYRLQTAMPSAVDMPDLLLELDTTAKAAGVSLESISPSPLADSGNGYATERVSVTADGNFYTLTDLLFRLRNMVFARGGVLESNGRIFSIDTVTISPNGNQLSANITLETYVYGALPGSTSTSPVPGDTSTTDTTTSSTPSSTAPPAAGATP